MVDRPGFKQPTQPDVGGGTVDVELVVTGDIAGVTRRVEDPWNLVGHPRHICPAATGMGEHRQRVADVVFSTQQR
ncbi:hypothetical protein D3C80_1226530 [compost metagenome]